MEFKGYFGNEYLQPGMICIFGGCDLNFISNMIYYDAFVNK